jgi:hypothetical protein
MKKRVSKFKPPLPSLSSCVVNITDTNGITSNSGYAAKIGNGHRWVRGTRCERELRERGGYIHNPPGCTATGYFAEVRDHNGLIGETYYFEI